MREYFDLYYYRVLDASATKRYVFVVFCDALPTVIDRLLENNRKLDHVWLVCLPLAFQAANQGAVLNALTAMPPKTPPLLACSQLMTELYKQLAGIFRPLLTRKL